MPVHSKRPRRVLVLTDLSEAAEGAVGRAVGLAERYGARLDALFVAQPGVAAELMDFARSRLAAQVGRYARTGADTAAVVRAGPVTETALDEARRTEAELLVVGAQGAHRSAGSPVGTLPRNLARACGIPLLIVRRPEDTPYREVLLAVDGSRTSSATARTGIALTPGAEHLLAHAVAAPGENLLLLQGVDDAGLDELRRAYTEQARPGVERVADELDPPPARILVVPGRPQDVVPELAGRWGVDLVVVGTGARSAFGYAVLGSVAEHVVVETPCDVLVVPGPGR